VARYDWHLEEFVRVRKSPGMIAHLEGMGEEWVGLLNTELHAAQTARKQPVEDGYVHHITTGGSRARLYIVAKTARAQAHEAKHSSILKLMRTSGHDVKRHARDFKNPTKGWRVNGSDDQGNPIHGLD
jgi:hypothetical protein